MFQLICNWLYQNAMAIFISSIVSLLISRKYYNKGNRDEVLITIIFPTVQLLEKGYSRKNYEKLMEIASNYAIRYLYKNERNKLLILLEKYSLVYRYDKYSADIDCIMLHYDNKLKENGINPMPCAIRDDDGENVADDYPPDYNYLREYIYGIVSSMEYVESPNSCTDKIVGELNWYTRNYYTDNEIIYFDDCSLEKMIQTSDITKKWNKKFQEVNESKEDFLNLKICKKVLRLLHEAKVKR